MSKYDSEPISYKITRVLQEGSKAMMKSRTLARLG